MAIITDEATAETIGNLITRIRRAVGDTDATAVNNRWADAEIVDALNLELNKMSAEFGLGNSSQAMTSTTLTYTAGAETVTLPSGPDVSPIFLVEDITNTANPIRIEFASFLEAGRMQLDSAYLSGQGYRWSRAGDSIALRPSLSTAVSLRIWYMRAPYGTSTSYAGTDQQPWPVQHEELISLGAAIRLQEVDEEVPGGRVERYVELWNRFVRSKNQHRGPVYVRRNRRYK